MTKKMDVEKRQKKVHEMFSRHLGLPENTKIASNLQRIELEGYKHAKFLLPIEYLPSRDYKPRYGHSHPPLKAIEELFSKYDSDYQKIIDEMDSLSFPAEKNKNQDWLDIPMTLFDAAALYTFMGKYKPKTFLEIGSGSTTRLAKTAIQDFSLSTTIVSIDPEPRAEVDSICDEVIRTGLESADLSVFDTLEENDIVFMDGSHRCFMNSDVTVFMLEVVPRLKPGVIVHIHDIFLPYDYIEEFQYWYWSEQYMVAMYLIAAADRVRPILPTAYITAQPNFKEALKIKPIFELNHEQVYNGGSSLWFTNAGG